MSAAVRRNYAQTINAKHGAEAARNKTPERKAQNAERSKRHREKNPEKYRARCAVNNALRDGRLKRGPCKHCGGTERVQAHHADYSKPLDVEWVCFGCHREHEHGQTVTAPDDGRGTDVAV